MVGDRVSTLDSKCNVFWLHFWDGSTRFVHMGGHRFVLQQEKHFFLPSDEVS